MGRPGIFLRGGTDGEFFTLSFLTWLLFSVISPVDRVDLGVPQGESLRKKSPSLSEISELIRFMLMMLKSSMELYSDFVDVSEDIDDIMYVCPKLKKSNIYSMIECQPFIKSQYQILRYGFNIVACIDVLVTYSAICRGTPTKG